MSSKQDENYEQKMAEVVAQGEKVDEMNLVGSAKGQAIRFPNETWEEIFMWCNRVELGEGVSLTNDRSFCISYSLMHEEKQHDLPCIEIFGGNSQPWMKINYDEESTKDVSKADVPTVEIPENIVAANHLTIRGIDSDVVKFLQILTPLITAITIDWNVQSEKEFSKQEMKQLIGLFNGKVKVMHIGNEFGFTEFHKNYEFVLKSLTFIAIDQQLTEQESNIVKNWLYEARDDGKPKIAGICLYDNREFIETIKKDFNTTDRPISFLIGIESEDGEDLSCEVANSATNERLTIQPAPFEGGWLIARLAEDCQSPPQEMFDNILNSFKRFSRLDIHLL